MGISEYEYEYRDRLDRIIKEFYLELISLDASFIKNVYHDEDYITSSKYVILMYLKNRSLIAIDILKQDYTKDLIIFDQLDHENNRELFYEITHLKENCFFGPGFIKHTMRLSSFKEYLFKIWLLKNI